MIRYLQIICVALGLGVVASLTTVTTGTTGQHFQAFAATDSRCQHVYVFRGGVGGIFSLGMNTLAKKLRQAGLSASAHSQGSWRDIASSIHRKFISSGCKYAVVIGHSSGGNAAASVANSLRRHGVPIRLLVAYDTARQITVGANVRRAVSYTVSGIGRSIRPDGNFRGTISNRNVGSLFFVDHITIDQSSALHRLTVAEVRRAFGR